MKVLCKRDYLDKNDKVIFDSVLDLSDNVYICGRYYDSDFFDSNNIFIVSERYHIQASPFSNGIKNNLSYMFCFEPNNKGRNKGRFVRLFGDYFYTSQELRKIKLEKLKDLG